MGIRTTNNRSGRNCINDSSKAIIEKVWFISPLLMICSFVLMPTTMFGQKPQPEIIIKTSCFKRKCVKPTSEIRLDPEISEGSGLVAWNKQIWTHNDSGGPARIFALDTIESKVIKRLDLSGIHNDDWEDITQDDNFLYIGNFGNNAGTRKRLQIYRLNKEALLQNDVKIDSISFVWPEINDFGKQTQLNFDCEAMVIMNDSLFLFTKEWKERRCSRIFKIPASPGNHIAGYVATLKTRLLVTGASYSAVKKRIVLCGYNLLLKPKLLVISIPDSGNLKDVDKGLNIRVKKRLKQIEGITSFDGVHYYVLSEATNLHILKNKPTLYQLTIN